MVHESSYHLSDAVVKNALEIPWYPDYMKNRLIDWTRALDWDWVVSRQRLFATPIPVWYCKSCGEVIVAEESWVPIDPRMEKPRIDKCPRCGGTEFTGETDVLDTWMDSSITCAVHAGWPDRPDWKHLFPASMHPSRHRHHPNLGILPHGSPPRPVRRAPIQQRPHKRHGPRRRRQKNEQIPQKLRSRPRSPQQKRRRRNPPMGCWRRSNRLRHSLPRPRRRIRQTLPNQALERRWVCKQPFGRLQP